MDSFFESFLRVAVFVFVVGPAIAWIMRNAARERKEASGDLDHFSVHLPTGMRVILAGCSVAFELIMLAVYVWQGVSLGEWDEGLMWFGHAMAIAGLSIWALMSLPRIDVDGDSIRARNALGRHRSTTFSQITKATLDDQMMTITLYEGEEKFASISLECVCSLNLLARLEEEGIEVSDAVKGHMTKARLCWAAVKPLAVVFLGMAVVFSLVIAFMAFVMEDGLRMLALVPFLIIFVGFGLPLLMTSMTFRGIYEIGKQERSLGFSFAEEMASLGAKGSSYIDDDWFIEISNVRIIAFRRDYLKKVAAHESSENGDCCVITTAGDRKVKIYAAGGTLEEFRDWFLHGASDRTMTDRAEGALETIS